MAVSSAPIVGGKQGNIYPPLAWERFYVAISRNRAFTARKSESPVRRYRAQARRSTARLQTDVSPSRDGSEQFGSGTGRFELTLIFFFF
jgi:hypothetical protein